MELPARNTSGILKVLLTKSWATDKRMNLLLASKLHLRHLMGKLVKINNEYCRRNMALHEQQSDISGVISQFRNEW